MPYPTRAQLDERIRILEGELASVNGRVQSLEEEIAQLKHIREVQQGIPASESLNIKPERTDNG